MSASSRSVLPLAVALALGCMVGVILTTALREKAPRQRAVAAPVSSSRELRDVVERLVVAVRELKQREGGSRRAGAPAADSTPATEVDGVAGAARRQGISAVAGLPAELRRLAAAPPETVNRDELAAIAAERLTPHDGFKKFSFMTAAELLRRYGPPDSYLLDQRGKVVWSYEFRNGDTRNTVRFTMLNWIVVRAVRF